MSPTFNSFVKYKCSEVPYFLLILCATAYGVFEGKKR